MASGFKAGSSAIASGVTEVTLTGLAMGFTPDSVTVAVRQPSAESDLISGYLVGVPTSDGFTVALSSPTPSAGYYLDYVAASGGVAPTPGTDGTLQVSYTDLKGEVARFLGYDASALSVAQAGEVDGYIQSGLRQFYYPPSASADGSTHEWSFLKLDGSVSTTAGVYSYALPDGFGRVSGQLVYGDAEARLTVPVIPYGDILRMLNANPTLRDRPRFASVVSIAEVGGRGQKKKMFLFPTPDAAYTLKFTGDGDSGKIDATLRPFPLGGVMYSELIIESCLAIAEQKANDEQGHHTAKFRELLAGFISRDRAGGAQVFGDIGDPDGFRW